MREDQELYFGQNKLFDPRLLEGFKDFITQCPLVAISPGAEIKAEKWDELFKKYQRIRDNTYDIFRDRAQTKKLHDDGREQQEEARKMTERKQEELGQKYPSEISHLKQQIDSECVIL